MLHRQEITGVVLAGGKSTRFGSNKALSQYRGKTFLQHTIGQLQPYTREVVIAGFYPEYENTGVAVLEDKYTAIGPLGGIYTAMTYATKPWLLVLTCDMPLVNNEIIMHMLSAARGETVVGWEYGKNGGAFPLLISKDVLPNIEKAIAAKHYRVKQLFTWGSSKILTAPTEWQQYFTNINSLEEYKQVRK